MNPRNYISLLLLATFFGCNNSANTTLTEKEQSVHATNESRKNELATDTILPRRVSCARGHYGVRDSAAVVFFTTFMLRACRGEEKFAENPDDYGHRSAGFYIGDKRREVGITAGLELQDIDLTKSGVTQSPRRRRLCGDK